MSAPATPVEVVRQLSALTEKLNQHVRAYSEAEREAVQLRRAADVAEAKAYLRATGSIPEREAQATVETDEIETKAAVAEALVRTLKAKIRAIEVDIECHRTYGTTLRAELRTLGFQEAS